MDDARHNRTALREILNDNYIVLEAENGQNALAVLEEKYQAVTVIILDLIMPDMSGLELLEILDVLADKGSRMAVSDVGVAVQFTRTALLGAVMNVYINTKSIKNREKAEEINQKAKRMINLDGDEEGATFVACSCSDRVLLDRSYEG